MKKSMLAVNVINLCIFLKFKNQFLLDPSLCVMVCLQDRNHLSKILFHHVSYCNLVSVVCQPPVHTDGFFNIFCSNFKNAHIKKIVLSIGLESGCERESLSCKLFWELKSSNIDKNIWKWVSIYYNTRIQNSDTVIRNSIILHKTLSARFPQLSGI